MVVFSSECWPPCRPPAVLQALSGFVRCQSGRMFSHSKHSAGSRTVGWMRMLLLTHDSFWQQSPLAHSAVNLGWGLNDSCGHAEPPQRAHNAVLTTADGQTPVGQETDPNCSNRETAAKTAVDTHSSSVRSTDAHAGTTWTTQIHVLLVGGGQVDVVINLSAFTL